MSQYQTQIVESGQFFCPHCGDHGDYQLNEVIEVGPDISAQVQEQVQFVECQHCHATFKESILNHDDHFDIHQFEAEFMLAIREVMIFIAQTDGDVPPDEIDKLQIIYTQLTGHPIDETTLNTELKTAHDHKQQLMQLLEDISPFLNHAGRASIFEASLFVASADADFTLAEQELCMEIAFAVGMNEAEVMQTMEVISNKLKSKPA